jgi:sulfite reductase (NADPH) hemoprotein beta-component
MSTYNDNERIKAESDYLRGTLAESLADSASGAIAPDDTQIGKFHGFYQQDDRDERQRRRDRLQEPAYSFMLRARLPGGVCTARQWLVLDEACRELANGNVRLTTRQTFQLHGILKHNLGEVIRKINQAMIDSIGGCGDINRNVLCNPNPLQSGLHGEVHDWARRISEHLLPRTRAYHELWLDGERVAGGDERETVYGRTYLPRKFKTALAVPPHNDVDVFTNDLGFIAIEENGRLSGFNVLAGGGMGTTHGDSSTFPRLADVLGFIEPERALAVAEAVVTTQRDHGNRASRRHARLKYTIEAMGLDDFRREVERRAGVDFAPPRPFCFTDQGDRYGWVKGEGDYWHLTLYIENGRLGDNGERQHLAGLREIARVHRGDFRITPNQNLMIVGVSDYDKPRIEALAGAHGLLPNGVSRLRRNSMACVALPTCPQAMAEAERCFPSLLDRLEKLAAQHGLQELPLVTRMTGCPNGCARPFVAEVGLVGKGPGSYNLHLGGDGTGGRVNRLYRENIREPEILAVMDRLFGEYSAGRHDDERFGDFVIRNGIVKPVVNPATDFHD